MSKLIFIHCLFFSLLLSCAPSLRNSAGRTKENNSRSSHQPGITDKGIIDSADILQYDFLADKKPLSLMELPETEEGGFVLSAGYYEADFKSYCLQPGTPDPSPRDAYLQAPLKGYRKDIIESILRNSQKKPYLNQQNIQLLLWSVVSGSNFNKLSSPVQSTASQLLSSKQIFELKGGVMGVIKTLSVALPSGNNNLQKLFDIGTDSYEAFERMAVLRQPSEITHPEFKKDQWQKHEEGYYVRYFPAGYQKVRIQVYVPDALVNSPEKYILFDPVSMMAMPANSNAQKLGIGAPVIDIVRRIITIPNNPREIKKLPNPGNPKNPKTGTR